MIAPRSCLLWLLCIISVACCAQEQRDQNSGPLSFPSRLIAGIQHKTAGLDHQLTQQTEKYLERMARRERRLYRKLYKVDSSGAQTLFGASQGRYAALN